MSRYIDADKLIRSLAHYKQGKWGEYETLSVFELESAIENFADTNEADVQEVRHGRWILNDNGTYSCSLCQSWIPNEQHYYARHCLYCGAKMQGGDAE